MYGITEPVRGWRIIVVACALLWGSVDALALRCVTPALTPKNRCTPVFRSGVSRARYFNPNTGRFWTRDTDDGDNEDPLSLHKYLYAWDNPVNNTDPSGNAVYFVERRLSMDYGWLSYKLANVGHGYLLFTLPIDPGTEGDPLTHGYGALTTFSFHPYTWNYADQAQGYLAMGNQKVPARVWERHTDDTHPSSYHPYIITANAGVQAALLNSIRNWIFSEPVGYDEGAPKQESPGSPNTIGRMRHDPAPETGVYYSVLEQNCVWWATIMLVQNNITIPPDARTAIMSYNHGGGAASQVLSGTRNATTVHTMNDILEGMSLQTGGYNVDMGGVGLGGF
jgi:hypothetical protein